MLTLAILASGSGSNMQSIVDACGDGSLRAQVRVVIGNNSTSGALARARAAGIPTHHLSATTHPDPDKLDQAMAATLGEYGVKAVCLAGYMKLLGPRTLEAYRGRILNIHPALLPKYGGRGFYGGAVHKAVLAAGEVESGATVHLVDAVYDHGPILAQSRVPVLADDTVESLAARVLEQEHVLYVETLRRITIGKIALTAT
jgi:phosphoribosylglycinamide formyltransferase-1